MTGPIRALNPVDRARSAGRQYRNRLPRQRRVQMRMWRILALYGLLLTVYWAAFGEEAEPYPRVTQEAFEGRRPFFAYDKDIPLDVGVVIEKQGDHSTRWKLVFRGVQRFLVPGYLEIPKMPANRTAGCALPAGAAGRTGGGRQLHQRLGNAHGPAGRAYAVLAFDAAAHNERSHESTPS